MSAESSHPILPIGTSSQATRPYIHTEPVEDTSFDSNSDTLLSSASSSCSTSPYLKYKESFEDTRLDVDYQPDQNHAREAWEHRKSSGLSRAVQYLRENTSARCYYVAGIIAVVLLVVSSALNHGQRASASGDAILTSLLPCPLYLTKSITSSSTPVVQHVSSSIKDIDVSAFTDRLPSLGKSKSTCDDPFAMPGCECHSLHLERCALYLLWLLLTILDRIRARQTFGTARRAKMFDGYPTKT